MKPKILSMKDIEAHANDLLTLYVNSTGEGLKLPIPIERIVEDFLDVRIMWDVIPSEFGDQIASKISTPTPSHPCRITMNEELQGSHFNRYAGLENTVLAHEVGHHQLHIDHSKRFQLSLGIEPVSGMQTSVGFIQLDHLDDGQKASIMAQLRQTDDEWWTEWQAHTFMRFLLMPRTLLMPLLIDKGYRDWKGLYRLRDSFGVTISALTVHLTSLGFISIDPMTGRIHEPKTARARQASLGILQSSKNVALGYQRPYEVGCKGAISSYAHATYLTRQSLLMQLLAISSHQKGI